MTNLEQTVARITANSTLLASTEEATRQAAILPVLSDLGWQWHNIDEVVPEYGVGSGRVDYCLRHHGRSAVFIEVKRAGTDLHPHQKQLLQYAFDEGAELAVLTDGLVWWFYLPTAPGSWEQRRFFSIDFRRVEPERSSSLLTSFLSRDSVLSGQAVETAKSQFARQERARLVQDAFPIAWRQLLEGPDELLVDLVADAVTGIAGQAPDAEEVARFLATLASSSPPRASEVRPVPPTAIRPPKLRGVENYTGLSPKAVVLNGVTTPVSSWRDVLTTVCGAIASNEPDSIERMLKIRGRKRAYFSRTSEDLTRPLSVYGTSIFVEGNLSANDIVKLSRVVLRTLRGSDAGLSIALDGDAPIRRRRPS